MSPPRSQTKFTSHHILSDLSVDWCSQTPFKFQGMGGVTHDYQVRLQQSGMHLASVTSTWFAFFFSEWWAVT